LIRHVVMWNVRGASRQEKDAAVASRVDYACDVVLLTLFESQAALDAYASHPEHLRVKQEIGDLRIARHQVDYQLA
jgi:hypothetical protein